MDRDIVLIIEGGSMLGVFGGGVVTAFQEADLYPRLHGVYAASSGAHDAAYFLSRQTRLGSSIYYEDLIGSRFIHLSHFWKFVRGIFCPRRYQRVPLVDIGYLIEIESTTKKLDVPAIAKAMVPFYIHVLDVNSHQHTFLDGTVNTMQALKATASLMPFYPEVTEIDGKSYIDGATIRKKNMRDIIKQNPDKKIIYISNRRSTFLSELYRLPFSLFESILTARLFGLLMGVKSFFSVFSYFSMKEIQSYPNVFLVLNDKYKHSFLTSPEKIREIYDFGREKGKQLLNLLTK